MDNVESLRPEDTENLQVSILDEETNIVYLIPNEYLSAVINKLKTVTKTEEEPNLG